MSPLLEQPRTAAGGPLAAQVDFFERVLREWIGDGDVTIACGRWSEGAISEILPNGGAHLLPARYDGCFAGVRELRLADGPHHLHIDLGRVARVTYAVAPCVCFAFKPSFEVRFHTFGPGKTPSDQWVVSVMLSTPYRGGELRREDVARFFQRAREHAASAPQWVALDVDEEVRRGALGEPLLQLLREVADATTAEWPGVLDALLPKRPPQPPLAPPGDPACVPLLREALALRDASLVLFRDRTLVEFKTEKLDGVHRYTEHGHVSWQIGAFDDHHCHLALATVTRVLFSAEPVSCQGGGLNYTAWFLTDEPCGNPYRRDGYFSIVLNRPYTGYAARTEVIEPMLALYRRWAATPWVSADETFLRVLAEGAPPRRPSPTRAIRQ